VPPERIVDYLTLTGDAVDNVPGVEKVGPKTAQKLIAEYGSLDAVLAHADKIAGKIGENLRAALPRLPLNQQLVTIKVDVPLDLAPQQLKLRGRNVEALTELYTRGRASGFEPLVPYRLLDRAAAARGAGSGLSRRP